MNKLYELKLKFGLWVVEIGARIAGVDYDIELDIDWDTDWDACDDEECCG